MDSGMVSPASPYLASALLKLPLLVHHKSPVSSGCVSIDTSALEGGYNYGEITCIAGTTGTGKSLLGYHSIASHLLAEGESLAQVEHRAGTDVALIDTTGGFSVMRLRDVLISRLKARSRRGPGTEDEGTLESKVEIARKAAAILGRVRVMRVFDLVGVMEALGEIGEQTLGESGKSQEIRKWEIGDSEDDEDVGDKDKEIQHGEDEQGQKNDPDGNPIGMIVIDTITNVVSSLISRSPVQGQALLANCMRSLQNVTTRHHICTILLNSAVGLNVSTDPQHRRSPDDNVSIFASSLGKPALGKTFAYLIDVSIIISLIPKTQVDATMAYGDAAQGRTWSNAIVLEVLKDKRGTREARWAAFEIVNSIELVPCFA